jgi:hypothetical protein
MKRLSLLLAAMLVLTIIAPAAGAWGGGVGHQGGASHPGAEGVTDDPAEELHPLFDFTAPNHSSLGSVTSVGTGSSGRGARRNLSVVGSLELQPSGAEAFGDVWGHKNLAFVGKWRGICPADGVDIIDISRPANPVKISSTRDYPGTSMEDMQVINIRGRDILGVGLQECGAHGTGTVGFELYDITDPHNPEFLYLFNGKDFADLFPADMHDMAHMFGHVHEFDVTKTPSGRVLALLASPFLELDTIREFPFDDGIGDLLIVDITDPRNPFFVSHWGLLGEPELGLDAYFDSLRGEFQANYAHSARANKNGTLAYVSYWDAGFVILDISEPENPRFLGRTEYALDEEGNAHSVAEARGGNILLGADEDFSPFSLTFTSSAFEGSRPAAEATFTPAIADQPGQEMSGEVVYVGRGCPADPRPVPPGSGVAVDDPYLADPAGKIALIDRGACRFDNKVARAQLAGATGVIVADNQPGLVLMGGDNPVIDAPDTLVGTVITIPAVSVEQSTGDLLKTGTPPVTARAAVDFVGWGFLRIFDISDPANPVQLSTFATENTFNPDVATEGTWSVHNPEVVGNTAYISWYNDGVRVVDISNPRNPREIAAWVGEDRPAGAPEVDIWSVVPHRNLLLASDRNYGLYVLRHRP